MQKMAVIPPVVKAPVEDRVGIQGQTILDPNVDMNGVPHVFLLLQHFRGIQPSVRLSYLFPMQI